MDKDYLASNISKGAVYLLTLAGTAAGAFLGHYLVSKGGDVNIAYNALSVIGGGSIGLGIVGTSLEQVIALQHLRQARTCLREGDTQKAEHFANEARNGYWSIGAEANKILVDIAKERAA